MVRLTVVVLGFGVVWGCAVTDDSQTQVTDAVDAAGSELTAETAADVAVPSDPETHDVFVDATPVDTGPPPKCTATSCVALNACSVVTCDPAIGCLARPIPSTACCKSTPIDERFAGATTFTLESSAGGPGWHVLAGSTAIPVAVGRTVLYYGNVGTASVGSAAPHSGIARSPWVAFPKGHRATLRFQAYLDLRLGDDVDQFGVAVVRDGVAARLVWSKASYGSSVGWRDVEVDLSAFGGAPFQLELRFDTSVASTTKRLGVLVDAFALQTHCEPFACVADADCADELALTTDTCTSGTCAWAFSEKACTANAACDDAAVCTAELCVDGLCAVLPRTGCCTTATDCDDQNPCTQDLCGVDAAGLAGCKHLPVAACCLTALDCEDKDPCSKDTCPTAGGSCTHTKDPTCCVKPSDCDDLDGCTTDHCFGGTCKHTKTCCTSAADCDDANPCTQDACNAGTCTYAAVPDPTCCPPAMLDAKFDDGKAVGWVMKSTSTKVKWRVWEKPPVGDSPALHFGDPETKQYGEGDTSQGYATSPKVTLPASPPMALTFRVYLAVEEDPAYDVFRVLVNTLDGPKVVFEKKKDTPLSSFVPVSVPLADFAGQTITVTFDFNTVDSQYNATLGVLVDQIRIAACAPPECVKDADCADVDPCTTDSCTQNACVHAPKAGCCVTDIECLDLDVCTQDTCTKNACVHETTCCANDAPCVSTDACISGSCVAGACVTAMSLAESCCVPLDLLETFDDLTFDGWTFAGSDAVVGFSVHAKPPGVTSAALYYGNPTTLVYSAGLHSSGTATSGPIVLPKGPKVTLSFTLWLDVEDDPAFDRLELRLLEDTKAAVVLFDKGATPKKAPVALSVDLSAFAGRVVRFQLAVDTVDDTYNDGQGVVLDDWAIAGGCTALPCANDAECGDGLAFTLDVCTLSGCAHAPAPPVCEADTMCKDTDPCTDDTCAAGQCAHAPKSCDDGDACTTDTCAVDGSCTHAPIAGCTP